MVLGLVQLAKRIGIMAPKVVFVLGGPGAGKGTQCQKIVKEYGFVHLSAGDLLRAERSRPDTKYGKLIDKYIFEGKIVPVEITCKLLQNAMETSDCDQFLIDGFPRNQNNLEGWQKEVEDKVNLLFVLFFDCPEEICTNRCLGRGAAGSGRTDDNMESLKKRFDTYINETRPIIDFYEKKQQVKRIDASNDQDKVFNDVQKIFQEYVSKGEISIK